MIYIQFFKGGYNIMGFYDNNRHIGLGSNIEFDLLEGYCGAAGAAMAALEGQQNDMTIFEMAIASDFQEAMAIKEGRDIEALQEASLSGMWEAIKNFFKKLGDKIKSLFTAFIAKMESYMKKDTKAYVEKYRSVINKKANFKDMKAKFSEPKLGGYVWNKDYNFKDLKMFEFENKPEDDDFDVDDFIDGCLKTALGGVSTTKKEFQKDLHDQLYEDEEVKDDWTLNDITSVMSRMVDADKAISNLKSRNDSLQSQIKKVISDISKQQTKVSKADYDKDGGGKSSVPRGYNIRNPKKDGKKYQAVSGGEYDISQAGNKEGSATDRNKVQVMLTNIQKRASAHQTAILTFCSGVMAEAKWGLAQDSRIFAQAVGYSPKNESALLAEAMGDVAQWECESYFEDAEILGA